MIKVDPKEVARRLADGSVVRIIRPFVHGCEGALSIECPFCHSLFYKVSSYPLKL